MRRRGVRFPAVLLAAACGAIAVAPAASAHTGELKTPVTAGPYRLVVKAAPIVEGGRAALTFRSSITDRHTGAAVGAARVSIRVSGPAGTTRRVYRAAEIGGVASLLIPIADASTWRSLRFTIEIAGPLGTASGLYVPPDLLRVWFLEPWVLLGAAIASICFLQGFWRLRRRGRRDHASWRRLALFAAGLGALVLPLVSPIDAIGDYYLLSVHMLQHVLIGDVAPALLLVSLRGPLLFFAVPPQLLRLLGRSGGIRRFGGWLSRPAVALTLWGIAYGSWHIPTAYDYATSHQTVHDLEHASFVLAGFLVWNLLVDPARHGRLTRGERLRVAGLLFLMGTVISDTLIFSLRPLYPVYAHQAERVFGLGPLHDQQLAGLVMTLDQALTLGTCAAFLIVPMLRERRLVRAQLARREEQLARREEQPA